MRLSLLHTLVSLSLLAVGIVVSADETAEPFYAKYKDRVIMHQSGLVFSSSSDDTFGAPRVGAHGMATSPDGSKLYVTSLMGQAVFAYDFGEERLKLEVPSPHGESDDITVNADGVLVWAAALQGTVWAKFTDGAVRPIAKNLTNINSVAFHPDGRLFATESMVSDAFYELFLDGKEPRLITEHDGYFNGFEFGKSGALYSPQLKDNRVVRVDVDKADFEPEVIFEFPEACMPAAVTLDDAEETLFAACVRSSNVWRIRLDDKSGEIVNHLPLYLDNIEYHNGRVYASQTANSNVVSFAANSVNETAVALYPSHPWGVVAGVDFWMPEDPEEGAVLYVADVFGLTHKSKNSGPFERDWVLFDGTSNGAMSGVKASANWFTFANVFGQSHIRNRESGEEFELAGVKTPGEALMLETTSRVVIADISSGSLVVYDGSGGDWSSPKTSTIEGFSKPVGLTSFDDKTVFVSDYATGEVFHVDLDSGERRLVAEGISEPEGLCVLRWDTDEETPYRIAVVETGNFRRLIVMHPDHQNDYEHLEIDLPVGVIQSKNWAENGSMLAVDNDVYLVSACAGHPQTNFVAVSSDMANGLYYLTYGLEKEYLATEYEEHLARQAEEEAQAAAEAAAAADTKATEAEEEEEEEVVEIEV